MHVMGIIESIHGVKVWIKPYLHSPLKEVWKCSQEKVFFCKKSDMRKFHEELLEMLYVETNGVKVGCWSTVWCRQFLWQITLEIVCPKYFA